jgi:hypothetical protein
MVYDLFGLGFGQFAVTEGRQLSRVGVVHTVLLKVRPLRSEKPANGY